MISNVIFFSKELFKRAENREQLKKRFEIQKKLRIQQKLKGNLTPKKRKSLSEDDEPSLAAHEKEKGNSFYMKHYSRPLNFSSIYKICNDDFFYMFKLKVERQVTVMKKILAMLLMQKFVPKIGKIKYTQ